MQGILNIGNYKPWQVKSAQITPYPSHSIPIRKKKSIVFLLEKKTVATITK